MEKEKDLRKVLLNTPNILCYFRILIIPVVLVVLNYRDKQSSFIAALLFSAAAITDYFDGYLARKKNQITLIGKFLDPLADKLIVIAVSIMLIPLNRIPAWLVVIIIARELTITALRGIASSEGLIIEASDSGKYKTALQLVGIILLLIHYKYDVDFIFFQTTLNFHIIGFWLVILSLVFSIFSAVDYIRLFIQASLKKK